MAMCILQTHCIKCQMKAFSLFCKLSLAISCNMLFITSYLNIHPGHIHDKISRYFRIVIFAFDWRTVWSTVCQISTWDFATDNTYIFIHLSFNIVFVLMQQQTAIMSFYWWIHFIMTTKHDSTIRPRKNGRQFAGDICKCVFVKANFC